TLELASGRFSLVRRTEVSDLTADPAGNRAVFSDGRSLWLLSSKTLRVSRITHPVGDAYDLRAEVSSIGRVAFLRYLDRMGSTTGFHYSGGAQELYVIDSGAAREVPIPVGGMQADAPHWDASGDRLLFISGGMS